MKQQLVALHGTGDAYLVCALVGAFEARYGVEVEVVLKHHHAPIAEMFPVSYSINDAMVESGEQDIRLQTASNRILQDDRPYFVHPSFIDSGARLDQLAALPRVVNQADMYRALLHLPPTALLGNPGRPASNPVPDTVLLIPEARSWPNIEPRFWNNLTTKLIELGREITFNNSSWGLAELFQRCATSEWVIGPQCGIMSILCDARFPCRKTFATPRGDERPEHLGGYAPVTCFTGDAYDVDDLTIGPDSVEEIITGPNALRLWPHDPNPVALVDTRLSVGDFLDRFAVLSVKRSRFGDNNRAAITHEWRAYSDAYQRLHLIPEVARLLTVLIDNHTENFDLLERAVPNIVNGAAMRSEDHAAAVRLNQRRVTLRREIDQRTRSGYTEVKSYYDSPVR